MARYRLYRDGNAEFHLVTLRQLVRSRQFRAGFNDYLRGKPFPNFVDDWTYDRGRLTAAWLVATCQRPPSLSDVDRLMALYQAAEAADVVL
jgi:hypothetical protein